MVPIVDVAIRLPPSITLPRLEKLSWARKSSSTSVSVGIVVVIGEKLRPLDKGLALSQQCPCVSDTEFFRILTQVEL